MGSERESDVSEIYREHAAGLLRYARTMARDPDEARDAVQETFLRYCTERRDGRVVESPRAWLFQVLRNLLLTKWNSATESREVRLEWLDGLPAGHADPEAAASRRERAAAIRARLSERELDCLRLRAEGLSYSEVGEVLGIASGTVGALLTRVTRKLRALAEEKGSIGLGTAEAVHSLFLGGQHCQSDSD